MKEELSESFNDSKLKPSQMIIKHRTSSKLSMYETNMQNFTKNQKFNLQKIDPKGITANGIFGSFSGVIQQAQLFSNCDETLQISYKVFFGQQWHDETPETDDTEGYSQFCQSKNGKITFSLSFDFLISCMYVITWPQIIFKVKGFNNWGELVTRGYAQLYLPSSSGQYMKKPYIYTIIKNEKWYHRWLPFLEPDVGTFDDKEFERVIVNGEGRQTQKIKSVGMINIRVEAMLRNFNRFGYK